VIFEKGGVFLRKNSREVGPAEFVLGTGARCGGVKRISASWRGRVEVSGEGKKKRCPDLGRGGGFFQARQEGGSTRTQSAQ